MDRSLVSALSDRYKSQPQKIRVLTEAWVEKNIFCPYCGNCLVSMPNNMPVGDFKCSVCEEEYELKSKSGSIGKKVSDGAYGTMIERINGSDNPNFFFLSYDRKSLNVRTFCAVPKYFFTPRVIEKRKPLSENAKRAGWVGCNILLRDVPVLGRIYYLTDDQEYSTEEVAGVWNRTAFISAADIKESRGWGIDILHCLDRINSANFTVKDVYRFSPELSKLHLNNNNVDAKIRQQLQILRDKGILKVVSRGVYQKIY